MESSLIAAATQQPSIEPLPESIDGFQMPNGYALSQALSYVERLSDRDRWIGRAEELLASCHALIVSSNPMAADRILLLLDAVNELYPSTRTRED